MVPLSIRKAEQRDADALRHLMKELSGHNTSQEQMTNRLQFVEHSEIDSLFVCEEDGEILGLLGFRIRENLEEVTRFGEVSAIVVDPSNRCGGAGRLMMDYAEELARERGCIGTWLVSGFGREEESHEFYRKLGYEINGYRFVKLLRSSQG